MNKAERAALEAAWRRINAAGGVTCDRERGPFWAWFVAGWEVALRAAKRHAKAQGK